MLTVTTWLNLETISGVCLSQIRLNFEIGFDKNLLFYFRKIYTYYTNDIVTMLSFMALYSSNSSNQAKEKKPVKIHRKVSKRKTSSRGELAISPTQVIDAPETPRVADY